MQLAIMIEGQQVHKQGRDQRSMKTSKRWYSTE